MEISHSKEIIVIHESIHFGKHSLKPPNIYFKLTNSISSARIRYPNEVAEVKIRASGGCQISQGPGKKIWVEPNWRSSAE